MRKTLAAVAGAATLSVSLLAVPTAAEAASRGGCPYPDVCFYQGDQMIHPSGRFKDRTRHYQWLSQSFGAHNAYNARRHDGAKLLATNGRTYCIRPGQRIGLANGGFTAIRILSTGC